uniref:TSA: Wollemia nobilis Ref_Wollemi_Transcript_14652_2207 transcribed RNA sequence n=1 Tax=Wollemia nobilis TaxID=56998 RepID=A0A0C9RJF6_9CONI
MQSRWSWRYVGLTFVLAFGGGMSDLRTYRCKNDTTYPPGSRFSKDFERVLDNLVQSMNVTAHGFNTYSYGEVNGLVQCRGDLVPAECSNCLGEASFSVQQMCGNAKGGLVWLERCFLRYSNHSFSQLDARVLAMLENPQRVTKDPDGFGNRVADLLRYLMRGASDPAHKGFAAGFTRDSSKEDIYGLVECLRDLSAVECRTCLSIGFYHLYPCCAQKQGAEALLGSCTLRFETYPFFNLSAASPFAMPLTTPTTGSSSSKTSSRRVPILVGAIGSGLLAVAVCVCLFLFLLRNKVDPANLWRPLTFSCREVGGSGGPVDVSGSGSLLNPQMIFRLETLIEATANFHEDNKLGEGGFGPVYKGTTSDGKEIAVKKLSLRSVQGTTEFMNEVRIVAKIQHRNLVKLLGCCAQGPERLLVYEYLPNKSLDTFLFDPERRKVLDWEKRYNIVVGIARGLLYLHEDSQVRIIHRDIKANNILLDEKLKPKIADFGLARLFAEDQSHLSTGVAGTLGYMAPEYIMHGQLTEKADVFSFGVLLLEIVSGKKNNSVLSEEDMLPLLDATWKHYEAGTISETIDPCLKQSMLYSEEMCRVSHIALLCTQGSAQLRPTMSEIVVMLTGKDNSLPLPTQPAMIDLNNAEHAKAAFEAANENLHNSVSVTVNDATCSVVEPR